MLAMQTRVVSKEFEEAVEAAGRTRSPGRRMIDAAHDEFDETEEMRINSMIFVIASLIIEDCAYMKRRTGGYAAYLEELLRMIAMIFEEPKNGEM